MLKKLAVLVILVALLCPLANAKPKRKHHVAHAIGHVVLRIVLIPLIPVFFLIDIGGAA